VRCNALIDVSGRVKIRRSIEQGCNPLKGIECVATILKLTEGGLTIAAREIRCNPLKGIECVATTAIKLVRISEQPVGMHVAIP
jgi:hypothetical protein